MQRIAVIDYGMGNLRSVSKALETVAPGDEILVTSDVEAISGSDRIVCPGQGAARDCMRALAETGLGQLVEALIDTRPFLGICMGYQVLLGSSEENDGVDCLDLVPGTVRRFPSPLLDGAGVRLKVPHMGWSPVEQCQDHPLWAGIENEARFYFAHSYYCVPQSASVVAGRTTHGPSFAAAIARPGVFACQFHPEKSAVDGLRLLANFAHWDGQAC